MIINAGTALHATFARLSISPALVLPIDKGVRYSVSLLQGYPQYYM